jgi:hypothetical protein
MRVHKNSGNTGFVNESSNGDHSLSTLASVIPIEYKGLCRIGAASKIALNVYFHQYPNV